ncbi:LysE family transporter [Glutamicibacter bergerei]|uniref:LysE family transporter n=2 Tax=Glutamicibacter TaxID=1742989 RepID=A0ABV9MPV5_9MICC|nr:MULTISPECIES: LysE family transporter [Micrococcaceae]PCC37040.1 lysine transporter LysE [Glutamicibacter sp. BW77]PRB71568.1 lysine transporter LysE [Arthrobacter sp. MYb213]GGJ45637.1 homoserine/homoserine lactone efflux protein [Glutamicibacter ardleyensis]HBV11009.1 lysine transporter LysE [Micrococcaceae bacterium]
MTLALWISLLGASIIISFTPGAGAINTMTNAMRLGFRGAIWGIIGQQIALLIHVIIVAAGVGILVASSPAIFAAVRYAGAAYLVYLGVRMILSKPDVSSESTTQTRVSGRWAMVRRGILVNLLNPKAIVFFLAFTPQFIQPGQPLAPQYAIYIGTIIVVDILVMWFFFAATARSFQRFTTTVRGAKILNLVFGTLFIFVAALLLLMH